MAWGRGKVDKRPELERIAAEIQEIYFRMPAAHRAQVAATIRALIDASSGLGVLPDELGAALGRAVWRLFSELNMPFKKKPSADSLVRQLFDGAPAMLAELGTDQPGIMAAVAGGK